MEKAHQIKHAQFVTKRERHDGGEVRDKICSDTFLRWEHARTDGLFINTLLMYSISFLGLKHHRLAERKFFAIPSKKRVFKLN